LAVFIGSNPLNAVVSCHTLGDLTPVGISHSLLVVDECLLMDKFLIDIESIFVPRVFGDFEYQTPLFLPG